MAQGEPHLQIQYSPGFTAGSFFLPVCVVGIAFYLFSVSESMSILGTLVGGLLVGSAVCGMHYMGQKGIANYTPFYSWRRVVGSAIIAVVASTVALGVFFHFKSTWTNSWWKRMSCASLLAVAVSGMHWVATVGTSYRVRTAKMEKTSGLSREATVVVVICLVRVLPTCLMVHRFNQPPQSIGCCLMLVIFALIGQRSRQRSADRAQQVVLACAIFDPEGRLLVTPEGLLPCRKITDSYNERVCDKTSSSKNSANNTRSLLRTFSIWIIQSFVGSIGRHVAGMAYRIFFRLCAPTCTTRSLSRIRSTAVR